MTMYLCCKGTVSIHTSTWEVTNAVNTYYPYYVVSIHTSTWEVTERTRRAPRGKSFNPHLHVGGDTAVNSYYPYYIVSIHTSTWEVTSFSLKYLRIR